MCSPRAVREVNHKTGGEPNNETHPVYTRPPVCDSANETHYLATSPCGRTALRYDGFSFFIVRLEVGRFGIGQERQMPAQKVGSLYEGNPCRYKVVS
jgi:hypothetical protein